MPESNPLNLKKGQKAYLSSIVNELKQKFNQSIGDTQQKITEIKSYYNDLLISTEQKESRKARIEKLENEINQKKDEIDKKLEDVINFYDDIFTSDEEENIVSKKDEITGYIEQISKNLKDIELKNQDLINFHIKIFGKKTADGKIDGGLQKELDERRREFEGLKDKIESLLPGATSAGLAYAYENQKNTFEKPKKMREWIFIISILSMVIVFFCYRPNLEGIDKLELKYLFGVLMRLPVLFPFIWLAVFSSKQQSKAQRLQQEYAYKETLSRSFEGYRREIENLRDKKTADRLANSLLEKVIEMSGYNPSITLDSGNHEEKPPITGEITDSVKGIQKTIEKVAA